MHETRNFSEMFYVVNFQWGIFHLFEDLFTHFCAKYKIEKRSWKWSEHDN